MVASSFSLRNVRLCQSLLLLFVGWLACLHYKREARQFRTDGKESFQNVTAASQHRAASQSAWFHQQLDLSNINDFYY